MPKIKRTEFTVRGTGTFPFDMLRYDQAWPARTEDAIALDRDNWRNRGMQTESPNVPKDVRLVTHNDVTPDRWSSFGWHVVHRDTQNL